MKVIKVTTGTAEGETTKVEVIAPGGDGSPDTTESCTDVQAGQTVLLNAEGDVTVGEVTGLGAVEEGEELPPA